jgi:hypothetical protein
MVVAVFARNVQAAPDVELLLRHYPAYLLSPPVAELLRGAVPNSDGTLTIPAGAHTAATNEYHRKMCESIGARDVTDESDTVIGSGTQDAFVCTSGHDAPPPVAGVGMVVPLADGRALVQRPTPDLGAFLAARPGAATYRIAAHAANAAVPQGREYSVGSYGDFIGIPERQQGLAVSVVYEPDSCSWRQAGLFGPGDFIVSGTVRCIAQGPDVATEMAACWNWDCDLDSGAIRHLKP